jgi:hypothetical protein
MNAQQPSRENRDFMINLHLYDKILLEERFEIAVLVGW